MKELRGRTAFVTGGASGIGLALAHAFGAEGMRVAIADIEKSALLAAREQLGAAGVDVLELELDVADAKAVEQAAQRVEQTFGRVHVVCNNAGVATGGPLEQATLDDWNWVVSVNLMGVVHGVTSFLPRLRAHGEGGHIVNTASIAGFLTFPGLGIYTATKRAVVGLSEALHAELAGSGIGVSVLCPGFVRTRIMESTRNRPARHGAPLPPASSTGGLAETGAAVLALHGADPASIAARVVEAVKREELYVFTHPELRDATAARFATVLEGFGSTSDGAV
jgi:NAD(P)-dependent dehydrogenase (short-subunit alcohol dehydrogenase family)